MYGTTMNCSLVENDGKYELGIKYTDSDGIDIDYTTESEDVLSLIEDAYEAIANQYEDQKRSLEEPDEKFEEESEKPQKDEYTLQLEKIIEDLTIENNSLKTDLDILQRRADDAVNEKLNNKKPNVQDKMKSNAVRNFPQTKIVDPFDFINKFIYNNYR